MYIVNIKIGDKTLHLLYNIEAMFEIYDRFKTTDKDGEHKPDLSELSSAQTKESFQNLCALAAIMAEQGEMYRRYRGKDPEAIPTEEDIKMCCGIKDYYSLRTAIMKAAAEGLKQETGDKDAEIDIGLLELKKKKGSKKPK
ncbi:MAG: hypothetical protein IJH92_01910 [Mogibacterium sp.]|nr:hypothetical protein [Clostridia bacterium]MBR0307627.1 hypothetical protein [Mogibacterium sp.]